MTTNKTTILVVEDNAINRAVLGGILSPTYTVLEAENGREALAILQEHKEDISLILLDIVMPVMDGYAFLSHIGADPAYFSIPVIVTTQSGGESDEVAALSHGAADFVAKPYRPQILLHRIANILHLRETAAIINQFQYDRLTGLYTKEFFYRRVRELLAQNPDKEYDLICSDIENFKLINDVFGMPAGDRLLCGIAALYTEMVGDRGLCSHFGADRFACLIERPRSYEDAWFLEAGTRINAFSSTKNVVMKWGIYPVEDRGISVEQMCDRALLAARGIKGRYGTHFAAYDDELRSKLLREQAITDGMEAAVEPSGVGAPAAVGVHPPVREERLYHPGRSICLGKRLRRDASLGPKGPSARFRLRQCVPGRYLQRGSSRDPDRNRGEVRPAAFPPAFGNYGKRLHGKPGSDHRNGGTAAQAWICR